MTMTTPVFRQQSFAGYIDGTESGSTSQGTNTNWTQDTDLTFQIRFLVQETAGGAALNKTIQLEYNYNSGGWNDVNAASSVVRSVATTNIADGANTTQRLGAGTFITPNGAFDEVDGLAGGADLDYAGNDECEILYSVQIRSVDVVDGLTLQLRCKGLDTYTNTPTITVNIPPGKAQVSWAMLETPAVSATYISATITSVAEPQYAASATVLVSATLLATAEPQYAASAAVLVSVTLLATAEPQYASSATVSVSATLLATAEPQYVAMVIIAINVSLIASAEPQYEAAQSLVVISNIGTTARMFTGNKMGPFWYAGRLYLITWNTGGTLQVYRANSFGAAWETYGASKNISGAVFDYGFAVLANHPLIAVYLIVVSVYDAGAGPITVADRLNLITGTWSISSLLISAGSVSTTFRNHGNGAVHSVNHNEFVMVGREEDFSGAVTYRLEDTGGTWADDPGTGNELGVLTDARSVLIGPNAVVYDPVNEAYYVFFSQFNQLYYQRWNSLSLSSRVAVGSEQVGNPKESAVLGTHIYTDKNSATDIAVVVYLSSSGSIKATVFEVGVSSLTFDNTEVFVSPLISTDTVAVSSIVADKQVYLFINTGTYVQVYRYDHNTTSWSLFIEWYDPSNVYYTYSVNSFVRLGDFIVAFARANAEWSALPSSAIEYLELVVATVSWASVTVTLTATAEPQYAASTTVLINVVLLATAEPQYAATTTTSINATLLATAEPQYAATVIRLIVATYIVTAEPQYAASATVLVSSALLVTAEPQYDATVIRLIAATYIATAEPQYDATVIRLIAATYIATAEPQYDATVIRLIAATYIATAEPQYDATAGYLISSVIITTTAEPQYAARAIGIDVTIEAIAEPQYDAKVLGVYVTLGIISEPQYAATVPTAIIYAAFEIEAEPQYEATLLFELIQSYPQHVVRYLAIAPRDIVYQAQTTGEFIFDNVSGGLTGIRFQNPIGTASDAEINMSVDVGTSQGGRELGTVRLRKSINEASGVIYINEISYGDLPITEGMYITVRDEFLPSQRMLRLVGIKQGGSKYINKFTEYHDYDIYYSNQNSQPQPIIIVEGQYEGYPVLNAGWVDPVTGNRQVYFDCSKTFFPSGGQTIVTYNWDFKDAVSVVDLSDTRKLVTFPPDFRYVKLTVVSNTGKFAYRYIPIWAFNGTTYSPLTENGTVGFTVSSDTTDQGRNMSFSLFGDPDAVDEFAIPEGSLVCYFEEAYFGVEYLAAPFNYRSQFIGWATSDTVELKRTGQYALEVGGMKTWLDKLAGFGLQLNSDSSPQEWYELPKLNPDIIVAYVLREFTTVLELCNLYTFFENANWPDAPVHKEAINANSIWKQLENLVPSYDVGQIACDSAGNIHLTFHPSYPSSTIDRPESNYRFKLTDDDLTDATPISLSSYTQSKNIGKVDATGARWNGQAASIPVVMNSRAPGNVLGKSSGSDTLVFQRLRGASNAESQIRLNELSGHHYQRKNSQRGDLSVSLIGNYDVFEPARGDLVQLNLPVENLRSLSIDPDAYYLVKKVSISHNNQRGAKAKAISLTVEEVTAGVRGITQPVIVNENEINPVTDDFWTFNPATQYPTPTPVEQLYEDVEDECIKVVGIDAVTEVNVCYALAWDIYSGDIADTASLGEEEVQWRSIGPEVPNYKLADLAYYRVTPNHLVVRAAFYTSTKIKIFYCANVMTESPIWDEEVTIQMTGVQPNKVAISASRNQDRWAVAWAAKDGVRVYKFNGSLWQGPILCGSDAYSDPDVSSSSQGFDICVLNNRVIAPGASGNGEYKLYVIQEGETDAVELPNTPTFNALVHCLEAGTTYEFYAAAFGSPSSFYRFSESTDPTVTDLKPVTGADIPGQKNALAIDRNNENIVIWTTKLTETELRSQTESTIVASVDKVASISYPLPGRSYAALFANNGVFLGGGGDQIDLSIDAWGSIVDRYFNILNAFIRESFNAIVNGCILLPPVEAAPPDEDPIGGGGGGSWIVTWDPGGGTYTIISVVGSLSTSPGGNPGICLLFDNAEVGDNAKIRLNNTEIVNIQNFTLDLKADVTTVITLEIWVDSVSQGTSLIVPGTGWATYTWDGTLGHNDFPQVGQVVEFKITKNNLVVGDFYVDNIGIVW